MRWILIIIIALASACNSSDNKTVSSADSSVVTAKTSVNTTFPQKIAVEDLPASIRIDGKAVEAWKWQDNLGENILVLSQAEPHNDLQKNENDEYGQSASLHAVHYRRKDGNYIFVWGLNDEEKSCEQDVTCSFIPNTTTITDLDKDGIAEIKLQYQMACRGDVSPAKMKLVVNENGENFELTGNRWMAYDPDMIFNVTVNNANLEGSPKLKDEVEEMNREMGRYESERQFSNAPLEFLNYARNEWIRYAVEKTGG